MGEETETYLGLTFLRNTRGFFALRTGMKDLTLIDCTNYGEAEREGIPLEGDQGRGLNQTQLSLGVWGRAVDVWNPVTFPVCNGNPS